ncbi:MAG: hypothetical protein F4103_04645 [Boseongicola sp. SB0673_bin_14]|nr:hypothetical protein [Boseongicola sp. SB0673_bin_14]
MPADAAFDIRKEFRRLAESGSFDEAQADLLVDHSKAILVGVATKADLRHAVEGLEKAIRLVGLELSSKISTESNATFLRMIWVVGLGVAAIVGFIGVLTYFPPQGG